MSPVQSNPLPPNLLAAITKFYEQNDDMTFVQATGNRVFFEFLRTKPTLSAEELDTLHALSGLVIAMCGASKQANN